MKTNNYKKYVDILIEQYGIEYIKKLCAHFIEEHTIILHEVNNTLEPLDDDLSAVIDTIARGEYDRGYNNGYKCGYSEGYANNESN